MPIIFDCLFIRAFTYLSLVMTTRPFGETFVPITPSRSRIQLGERSQRLPGVRQSQRTARYWQRVCTAMDSSLETDAIKMKCIDRNRSNPARSVDSGQASGAIQTSNSAAALQQLIQQCDDPMRVLESYYWSKEPGLLECVRALLGAPADVRTVLQVFLAAAVVRESISASIDEDGALNLYSPEAAAILIRFFRNPSGFLPKRCC